MRYARRRTRIWATYYEKQNKKKKSVTAYSTEKRIQLAKTYRERAGVLLNPFALAEGHHQGIDLAVNGTLRGDIDNFASGKFSKHRGETVGHVDRHSFGGLQFGDVFFAQQGLYGFVAVVCKSSNQVSGQVRSTNSFKMTLEQKWTLTKNALVAEVQSDGERVGDGERHHASALLVRELVRPYAEKDEVDQAAENGLHGEMGLQSRLIHLVCFVVTESHNQKQGQSHVRVGLRANGQVRTPAAACATV